MAIKNFNIGVKAVITDEDRLLIVKHRTKGFWDVPGGRIDDDETIEETLRREIGEELPTASDVEIGDILHARRMPGVTFDDGTGLILIMYRVTAKFPEGEIAVSDEHSEARWATLEEATATGSALLGEIVGALAKRNGDA